MNNALLVPIEKYRGHVEYEHGHVHHLPISGWWTVDCYLCDGRSEVSRHSDLRRHEAIDRLAEHLATVHHV